MPSPQIVLDPIPPPSPLNLDFLYAILFENPSDAQPVQGTTPSPSPSSQDLPDSSNFPPQIAVPADDRAILCPTCSSSTSVPSPAPAPQAATFLPLNWYRIPQKPYEYGRKQWSFKPLRSIPFSVNGRPGLNIRDALCQKFTDLDGRDDLVLQDAGIAVSCRFSVRLS